MPEYVRAHEKDKSLSLIYGQITYYQSNASGEFDGNLKQKALQ